MTPMELQQRLKDFALRLVPLYEALPKNKICRIIEDQLLRSGFSAAAYYRSACNAQSKKAFIAKVSIALEEIDESLFWLETVQELKVIPSFKIELLLKEAAELTKILGATRRTTSQNLKSTIKNLQ